jgi:integrase
MKDMRYIRRRLRKNGVVYLIEIPYTNLDGTKTRFTQTIQTNGFESENQALTYAFQVRNQALTEIQSGKLKTVFPTIKTLYTRKYDLLPLSVETKRKQDGIYRVALEKFDNVRIDRVTIADIQTSLNEYALDHSSDAVSRLLTVWKQIYKCAYILGYNLPDLTLNVVLPRSKVVKSKRPVELSLEDFRAVLAALQASGTYNNIGLYYMLVIMYYTGIRPAEALALTRSDISEESIYICKSVGSTTHAKCQIVPPKTESSVRYVPIAPALKPEIEKLLEWSKHEYLLADEGGNLRDIDNVSNTIRLTARRCGVRFNAYMLRHLMSTDLLHAGDSVIARDLLGHTSFSMTLDYARSTDRQLYEAIAKRTIAENQPKNTRHEAPVQTIYRRYAIARLCLAMRFLGLFKGISENNDK